MSGYGKYSNKRLYWSREEDTPKLLMNSIRCNRFEDILHHIHLNDNSNHDGSDRLYKLRPLLEHLQTKCLQLNSLDECLSIDESMIPYYGRHFAKQFIKGKPIRFGFKNWALCSSEGYMYAFDVYVGKSENNVPSNLGAGGDVVMNLLQKCRLNANEGHKVFFDNYFTSYKLLDRLSSEGICATGTVRENRLLNCPLPKNDAFRKKSKQSHQFSATDKVIVMKYNDNNVVNMASNYDVAEISTKKRYSVEKKGYISVPQPMIVQHYNSFMGGVDKLDQFVASYRTRMRQKKWWWPIFIYFFDVVVVNSWILWKKKSQNSKTPLMQFRRRLAISILKMRGGTQSAQGRAEERPLVVAL